MGFTQDPAVWVAAGGDHPRFLALSRVGRVAALSDGDGRILAGIHPDRPTVGTLGDWAGGREVLEAGAQWLREQGCTAVEGPALLAQWFPAGASLGPWEAPPFPGEPTERAERWVAAGFAPISRWTAVSSTHDAPVAAAMDRAGALSSRGWTLHGFESGPSSQLTPEAFERAVDLVHGLAGAAFSELPGYLSAPRDAVADFYRPLTQVADPRLSLLARDPEGRPRGFLLGLPGPVLGKTRTFQIVTLAVHPEARTGGLGTWLVAAAHQAARKAGYGLGIHLVRGDSRSRSGAWGSGDVIREYALLRRPLG
jgi:GNAT superfamily N-acetyltransferase